MIPTRTRKLYVAVWSTSMYCMYVMLFAAQRQRGLPLSCLAGLELSMLTPWLGDSSINSHTDDTTRHNP